ncbi:RNA polymerase I-specific transcription initiation factor RRN6-like protein [Podospora aff. communis PSN243]|uniref:RNA polymerase I-specific transcription initiation factor RRN6-like protein n=1 Tax=Podospora aff. communis PSN243 TaxID=3040156 RepID=A0AAV9H6J0_9PEZI|nr:RNA polymerase I-specific transcription initiation factor RRN6-like protein [Podospora aff. communis PSN243]
MAESTGTWQRAPPPGQLDVWPHYDCVLGRVTYVPAENNQTYGEVRTRRMKDNAPRFHQVAPFEQWFAPEKTETLSGDLPLWRLARSQKNWLLNHYPEACLADEYTEMLLADEVTNSTNPGPQLPLSNHSSLLSVGEITDLRNMVAGKTLPAIAFASGESGHVLRLIGIANQEWLWDDEDILADINAPNLSISGEWCQDSQPISSIKFATDKARFEPLRWLLVQKATMTAVCEPEVKRVPTQTAGLSGDKAGAAQLFANPMFAIRSDQTGGGPQTDVSFRFKSDEHLPQLVIIDHAGNWSIWDIAGRRAARPKNLRPTLKMRGNILTGPYKEIPTKISQLQEHHNILWLSLRPDFDFEETSNGQSSLLLMCNSTSIHFYDVDKGRFLDATQELILDRPPIGPQGVLSAQRSPLHYSQAFILTNTMVFLVAVRETSSGKLSLDVLAALAHREDSRDPTLRMEVSPAAYIGNQRACFVCVRLPKLSRMTVVWFINPEPGMPFQWHKEIVTLQDPPKFSGMGVLRVKRREAINPEKQGLAPNRAADAKYFQLLALGDDLSLSCALCGWSEKPGVRLSEPHRLIVRKTNRSFRRRERQNYLNIMENAFVVPDGYDERPWHDQAKGKKVREVATDAEPEPIVRRVTNFRILGGRSANEGEDIDIDKEGIDSDAIAQAIGRETRGGIMPRHSLLDLVGPNNSVDRLSRVASEWTARQDHLAGGISQPTPIGMRFSGPELDDLVAKLEGMFIEPLDANGNSHIRESVRRMAAEIYLSEVGIVVKPVVAAAAAAASETDGGGQMDVASQASSHRRSSPPLGPSQEEPDLPTLPVEKEGPVSKHLREYAYMKPVPPPESQTTLLSHWDRSLVTEKIDWTPWEVEALDPAIVRRRKRAEKRRQKEEKLASRAFSDALTSTAMTESQPMPIIRVAASQREPMSFAGPSSSQMPPTSQPVMSQIVSGPYVGIPSKKAKKKGTSGFR